MKHASKDNKLRYKILVIFLIIYSMAVQALDVMKDQNIIKNEDQTKGQINQRSKLESGSQIYELSKGEWLLLQLKLQNPAQATIEKHGCIIAYKWDYPDTIVVGMYHLSDYNQKACELNLNVAKKFVEQTANSFSWKWVKLKEEKIKI